MMPQNPDISDRWFPGYPLDAGDCALVDQRYRDFDAQAERLTGHDQSYIQLTPGPFRGRFLSAFLGAEVSVHIEYCNQALEQCVTGSADHFTFGVVLGGEGPFRVDGQPFGTCDVMILPPGGAMHVLSPPGGAVMAIVVSRHALMTNAALGPAVAEWLAASEAQGAAVDVLHLPQLAARLREDARQALESATFSGAQVHPDMSGAIGHDVTGRLGCALVAGLAAKLTLVWGLNHGARALVRPVRASSLDRFLACRDLIHSGWDRIDALDALTVPTGLGKRSVQEAFSAHVSVGPLTYLRVLRLHLARRALQRPRQRGQAGQAGHSIGDIAAQHGFWNWSRFTQQYHRHFGETPSETRARI